MRSWYTARLPMAISISMSGVITVTRLETWDVCFQTHHQWSGTTALKRFCKETPRVGTGQITSNIGCIMACQELRIGEQLIDLAIAKDLLGRN